MIIFQRIMKLHRKKNKKKKLIINFNKQEVKLLQKNVKKDYMEKQI